jgi:hypothetical protein
MEEEIFWVGNGSEHGLSDVFPGSLYLPSGIVSSFNNNGLSTTTTTTTANSIKNTLYLWRLKIKNLHRIASFSIVYLSNSKVRTRPDR